MILEKPSYSIVRHIPEGYAGKLEEYLSEIARTSTESQEARDRQVNKKVTQGLNQAEAELEAAREFMARLENMEHWSVFRHLVAKVKWRVPRKISHEVVRHGLADFMQSSTRYINSRNKGFRICVPFNLDIPEGELEFELVSDNFGSASFSRLYYRVDCPGKVVVKQYELHSKEHHWLSAMYSAEKNYYTLLDNGFTAQEARDVLPIALMTTTEMTSNLDHFRQVLTKRVSKYADPEFARLAYRVCCEFGALYDFLDCFDSICEDWEEL